MCPTMIASDQVSQDVTKVQMSNTGGIGQCFTTEHQ
jgi:hypothetical protein